jgi:hypothetical protein
MVRKVLPVLIPILMLAGCTVEVGERSGPVEHFEKIIELDKAESTRVLVKMGAGNLRIGGGSPKLLDAGFRYNVASWKPDVRYESSPARSQITIEQPSSGKNVSGDHTYEWDLKLNDARPLNLTVDFGAGEAILNLGSVTLNNLDINMGVGHLKLDLRGAPQKDYSVNIHGGVGQAEIDLPKEAGVAVEATGGLGSVSASGLTKRGDRYFNAAYDGRPKAVVHMNVTGGIGQIVLNGE